LACCLDKYDRRRVIIGNPFAATMICGLIANFIPQALPFSRPVPEGQPSRFLPVEAQPIPNDLSMKASEWGQCGAGARLFS
jgi:hypothetical protein